MTRPQIRRFNCLHNNKTASYWLCMCPTCVCVTWLLTCSRCSYSKVSRSTNPHSVYSTDLYVVLAVWYQPYQFPSVYDYNNVVTAMLQAGEGYLVSNNFRSSLLQWGTPLELGTVVCCLRHYCICRLTGH